MMAITPDPTRDIGDSLCSKCGRLLLVNDQALIFEGMRDGSSFVLGNCCADFFVGAVLQDYAVLLKRQSCMGYLIRLNNTIRLKRVSEAAKVISREYQLVLEHMHLTERHNLESE